MTRDPNYSNLRTLAPSLNEWAELEPNRCQVTEDGWELTYHGYSHELPAEGFYICGRDERLGILQRVVQCAITDHGWPWDLWGMPLTSLSVAEVLGVRHQAQDPVEALLGAYVRALRIMQARGLLVTSEVWP